MNNDSRAEVDRIRECPVCGEKYGFDSQSRPFHFGCAHDGDHDVCDPDDRHIPVG